MNRKSENNLDTAQFLINTQRTEYLSASIHCSYYAVLQYMKYILAFKVNNIIDYNVQESRGGISSHEYILEEVKREIPSPSDKKNISEHFRMLKSYRKRADYSADVFTIEDSLDCKCFADKTIRSLKTIFK